MVARVFSGKGQCCCLVFVDVAAAVDALADIVVVVDAVRAKEPNLFKCQVVMTFEK